MIELRAQLDSLASALGFDRVGVAPPEPAADTRFLSEWLERGYAGDMHYLGRRAAEREDPRRVLPEVRSIVCVGLVYDREDSSQHSASSREPIGRFARYAGGDDYHDVMKDALHALAAGLEASLARPFAWKAYVDTGPLLERTLAARAGLGWIGRNTCLIDSRLGSYLFLGCLLTDLPLEPDTPEPDHCGSCRACLDACPTDAFPEPYVMDARACLSYQTIEQRGAIPEGLRSAQADWVFGCDICQEVCPWNRRERRVVPPDAGGLKARIAPREAFRRPTLRWLLALDEDAWRAVTRKTAVRRAKWRGLLRNALVAAGNSGDAGLRELVAQHAVSDDPMIAEHAGWALAQLAEGRTAAREASATSRAGSTRSS